jgi:hypothetical protein
MVARNRFLPLEVSEMDGDDTSMLSTVPGHAISFC